MEAQGDPLKGVLPTLQTSLTHPELPPYPRHLQSEDLFRLLEVAGIWGKFFCWFWEVGRLCSVRLSHPFYRWGAPNGMRVVPCGLRPCRARNVSNSTDRKRGIVGNDPRVVPFWLKDNFYEECRLIPPHQSLARQTACSFLPPRGSLFARLPSHCTTKQPDENMK